MNREYHLRVRNRFHQTAQGPVYMVHGVPQIFAAVGGDENHPFMFLNGLDFRILEMVILLHRIEKGVDDRISYYENGAVLLVLAKQISPCRFRRRKVHIRKNAGELAVRLLRIGGKKISRPQARLHVAHFNLLVEGSQRRRKGGGGIAVHQYIVRLFPLQHILQPPEHPGGNVIERLAALHDVQIIVHRKVEKIHHLIQHFTVLGREAYLRFDFLVLQKLPDNRGHLDGFRPGAENGHYFHTIPSLFNTFQRNEIHFSSFLSFLCSIW